MARLGFIAVCMFSLTLGKLSQGWVDDDDTQWKVIDKFCFVEEGGKIIANVKTNSSYQNQYMALYYNKPFDGFEAVYRSEMACADKLRYATKVIPLHNLSKDYTIAVTGQIQRWWWVAFANCESKGNPAVYDEGVFVDEYSLHFTNPGGKFTAEFSYAYHGIFECQIFMLLLFIILLPIILFTRYRLSNAPTDKDGPVKSMSALAFVVFLHFVATCIILGHLDTYSSDGVGMPMSEEFYTLFKVVLHVVFMDMLLNMSLGLWIDQAQYRSRRIVVEILVVYVIASVGLLAYEYTVFDPVVDVYVWLSPPGTLIAFMRVLLGLWFARNLFNTYRADKRSGEKGRIYTGLGFTGLVWFPLLMFLLAIDAATGEWYKMRILVIIDELFTGFSYVVLFLVLYANSAIYEAPDNKAFTGIPMTQNDDDDRAV
jgi:hypothetical protein